MRIVLVGACLALAGCPVLGGSKDGASDVDAPPEENGGNGYEPPNGNGNLLDCDPCHKVCKWKLGVCAINPALCPLASPKCDGAGECADVCVQACGRPNILTGVCEP